MSEKTQEAAPDATHDHHARAKARFEFGDESERDAYVAVVVDQIAETTNDPGEDPRLAAYVAAVQELNPCVERWFAQNDYQNGFTVEKSAERWREHESYFGRAEGQ